jgi:fatty-acyl-CoA synthase
VVSAPDPQWGEVPAAFVVVKPGHTLDQAALCSFLRQRIAKFKMPRRFEIGDAALPKTGTSKIVKRALRETFWNGKETRIQG